MKISKLLRQSLQELLNFEFIIIVIFTKNNCYIGSFSKLSTLIDSSQIPFGFEFTRCSFHFSFFNYYFSPVSS